VLNLQSSTEVVVSKETGKPYLTARKTSIPCTFDDVMAKSLIGLTLPDEIERVKVEPYEFKVPGIKRKIKLTHSYRYSAEPATISEVAGSAVVLRWFISTLITQEPLKINIAISIHLG
jgi:hypothetical protein